MLPQSPKIARRQAEQRRRAQDQPTPRSPLMAQQLISFKDAVDASVLDPNATHAVYYIDGTMPNFAAVRARCPHAKLYGITVVGRTGKGVFACDCETGDLTVAQAVQWVARQVALGVELIVVYADLDTWENQGLLAALAHYGDRIRRWVADYDDNPEIPSWADAKQYATGDVDLDEARADFFEPNRVKPKPKPDPHHYRWFDDTEREMRIRFQHRHFRRSERQVVEWYDEHRHHPLVWEHTLDRLRADMNVFIERLEHLARVEPHNKDKWHRDWRLEQLKLRAAGHQVVK